MRSLIAALLTIGLTNVHAHAPDTKSVILDFGEGCRIRMDVPLKAEAGALRADPSRNVQGRGGISVDSPPRAKKLPYEDVFGLEFTCLDAKEPNLVRGQPVRFDQQQGKWVKDINNFLSIQVWVDELTAADRKRFSDAVRFSEIQTPNAQGFAYTQDDLTGEERGRRRQMFYCVFHEAKAVCGESTMGPLPLIRRNPKNDLAPYALRILRSIEFLPDASATEVPDTPASQTTPR